VSALLDTGRAAGRVAQVASVAAGAKVLAAPRRPAQVAGSFAGRQFRSFLPALGLSTAHANRARPFVSRAHFKVTVEALGFGTN